ncbi:MULTISPECIES: hypothetical protein [unclassified Chelatococcus]|uniref:hypothetical protein n=1 Tax=unclassified Chelatococcus TaxID=2638111 RepID=UPI001BCDA893|nr:MULTISPECIES: hypothetical protein [unclassified Chelatococcus]CAH1665528.1 hypothetical protein CHELA41_22679 [Hyphomicrobiales bacterium]MBS7737733.1 hypothetical protein [Chelatococcus sp. HY11]MBX3547222.1 hypothetical protein [Chelatococcus sp.]MCO5077139.1 hypothetical protein [Chelatococcus sp.]CAH1681277.1 hypothetical protein CHELA20_52240 [Hyphomicrobiales bacterium]
MNKGVEVKAIGPQLEIRLEDGLTIVSYVGSVEVAKTLARGFHNEHIVDGYINLLDYCSAKRNGRVS